MYFSALVNGASFHSPAPVFSNGEPEQITSGPTEESGVAITPDGASVFSAVGMHESGIWLHDPRGEHPLSSEGYASFPSFSQDGRLVYYLRREATESPSELWVADLASGRNAPIVEGFSILTYDVSSDGKEALFITLGQDGRSQIWLVSCDHSSGPRLMASSGEDRPFFGPDGQIIFRMAQGSNNYLFRMKQDGSARTKVMPGPIANFQGMSPDRRWAVTMLPVERLPSVAVFAVPINGGSARREFVQRIAWPNGLQTERDFMLIPCCRACGTA